MKSPDFRLAVARFVSLGMCRWAMMTLFAAPYAAADEGTDRPPEEPDYGFLTGGPYTQGKGLIQLVWASRYGAEAERDQGTRVRSNALDSSLRVEWGFTDYLEGDIVGGFQNFSVRADGTPAETEEGAADTLLGVRYRFLREDTAPLTLTAGPQIIAPTGDDREGFGTGEFGYALDVSAAKDWGGPVFLFASGNALWTPGVDDPAAGSGRDFTLRSVSYATALGVRLLEEKEFPEGIQEDIHLFLELRGAREDELAAGTAGSRRATAGPWELGLGLRYGLFTQDERFLEAGIAFIAGLNGAADDRAVILQLQWEGPLTSGAE